MRLMVIYTCFQGGDLTAEEFNTIEKYSVMKEYFAVVSERTLDLASSQTPLPSFMHEDLRLHGEWSLG